MTGDNCSDVARAKALLPRRKKIELKSCKKQSRDFALAAGHLVQKNCETENYRLEVYDPELLVQVIFSLRIFLVHACEAVPLDRFRVSFTLIRDLMWEHQRRPEQVALTAEFAELKNMRDYFNSLNVIQGLAVLAFPNCYLSQSALLGRLEELVSFTINNTNELNGIVESDAERRRILMGQKHSPNS